MASRVFIGVMPSPLLCSGNPTKWESFDVELTDKIRVYQTFASDGPGRPLHPTVNVAEAVKRIPANGGKLSGLPPQRNVPYLSVEPTNENKITLIPLDTKSDDELEIYPADTITYEVFEKMDARNYYEEAICNLRRFTRQVWIGRSATYTNPTTSCAFEFTDKREAHGAVFSFGPLSFRYKSIRLCTEEIWREAWRLAMAPSDELCVDMVHSAHHALLSDHEQEFYLQAGMTIERMKYALWDYLIETKQCTSPQHRSATNDTKKPQRYFSECLEEVCGRSLLNENPQVNTSVKRLWIARGLVAHGKKLSPQLALPDLVEEILNLYELARFVDDIRGKQYSQSIL